MHLPGNLALGYESTDDLRRDQEAIHARALPPTSALHASIPTVNDASQAPPGHHTSFGWQFVPAVPGEVGATWDGAAAQRQVKAMVDGYARYARTWRSACSRSPARGPGVVTA